MKLEILLFIHDTNVCTLDKKNMVLFVSTCSGVIYNISMELCLTKRRGCHDWTI